MPKSLGARICGSETLVPRDSLSHLQPSAVPIAGWAARPWPRGPRSLRDGSEKQRTPGQAGAYIASRPIFSSHRPGNQEQELWNFCSLNISSLIKRLRFLITALASPNTITFIK